MRCPKCGAALPQGTVRCPDCGSAVRQLGNLEPVVPVKPRESARRSQTQPPPAAPTPPPGGNAENSGNYEALHSLFDGLPGVPFPQPPPEVKRDLEAWKDLEDWGILQEPPPEQPSRPRKSHGMVRGFVTIVILAALATMAVFWTLAGPAENMLSLQRTLRGSAEAESASPTPAITRKQNKDSDLGSAGFLQGDVLLVSIYVDDVQSDWDERERADCISYVDVACNYLEEQAASYGQTLNLYYDVTECPDLEYHMSYEKRAVEEESNFDMRVWKWIDQNVPVAALQESYGTENIGFLILVADEGGAYTNVFYAEDRSFYYNEFSVLFFYYPYVRINDEEVPAVYAHEILHMFGAIDLYEGSGDISPENASYIAQRYPDDIMYASYDNNGRLLYDRIHLDIGPVTAYYLGWLDELPQQDRESMEDYERCYRAGFSNEDPTFEQEWEEAGYGREE